jgi:hypothetical protein
MHIHDYHITCEVCENTGHSGNSCLEIHEDVNFINNNYFRPQQNQGWNQQQRPNYQGITKVTLKATILIISINRP